MLLLLKRSGYGQDVLNLYGSSAEGVTVLVCQRYSYSIDAATLVIKELRIVCELDRVYVSDISAVPVSFALVFNLSPSLFRPGLLDMSAHLRLGGFPGMRRPRSRVAVSGFESL